MAILGLPATGAAAQAPAVPGVEGRVTAANFPALEAFVTRHLDTVVRVSLTSGTEAETRGIVTEETGGILVAYRPGTRVQLSVTHGFTRTANGHAVEGFFRVRYAGMGQGIEAYALEPAPAPAGARVGVTPLP